ncbi:Phasin family protein [Burkholderiales bacterium]|nr:Phasin family protein [Burkholderiales bacterium]
MATTLTELVELQKSQLDAWNALGQSVFNAAEKLVNLNIAAAKAAFQDSSESSQSLLGARDAQDFFALASGASQPSLEKLVGYSRNVYGIANGTSAELTKIFEAQMSEANRKVAELIDFAAKNAPTGSEPAVSMFKTAVAAANTAFDTATKAARQATDWAEANFAAAASATINAANAANDAAKAKTRKAA